MLDHAAREARLEHARRSAQARRAAGPHHHRETFGVYSGGDEQGVERLRGLLDQRLYDAIELVAVERHPQVEVVDHDLGMLVLCESGLGTLDGLEHEVREVSAQ